MTSTRVAQDFRFRTPKAAAGDATPAAAHPLTYFRGLDSLRALTLRHCRLDVDGVRLMASLLPQLQVRLAEGYHAPQIFKPCE